MKRFKMGPETYIILDNLSKEVLQIGPQSVPVGELAFVRYLDTPMAAIARAQDRGATLRAFFDPDSDIVIPVDLAAKLLADGSVVPDVDYVEQLMARIFAELDRMGHKNVCIWHALITAKADDGPKRDKAAPREHSPARPTQPDPLLELPKDRPAAEDFSDDEAPFDEAPAASAEVAAEASQEAPPSDVAADADAPAADDLEKLRAELNALGYAGLKEECLKHNLPTHGKRNELVDRLLPIVSKKG